MNDLCELIFNINDEKIIDKMCSKMLKSNSVSTQIVSGHYGNLKYPKNSISHC